MIDFKEGRHASFEYGRYGNPTTKVLEEKTSALERAESTLFVSSGMYASVALLSALVPPGGHIVITTDCYRKTRIFIQNELPKMGITNAAYMITRGMKTLHLRVQHQNSTALRMAQFLEEHPKIIRVYYPGLTSHPEHHIAKRQMTGFGGVVSFEVAGDLRATMKFIDSLKIPYLAPSFGGCESIVDQPAIMSYWDLAASERARYGIKDNLVRFSFGVEGFEDLKADILQALEKI